MTTTKEAKRMKTETKGPANRQDMLNTTAVQVTNLLRTLDEAERVRVLRAAVALLNSGVLVQKG